MFQGQNVARCGKMSQGKVWQGVVVLAAALFGFVFTFERRYAPNDVTMFPMKFLKRKLGDAYLDRWRRDSWLRKGAF